MKPSLVVLTGAGISAESGIPTFRGSDGLWEGHRVEDVASPEGWHRDQEMVLEFYNMRRKAVMDAKPNRGHEILAELEEDFDVQIVTQNIDDLHERAGSTKVLHLHGEVKMARSTSNPGLRYEIEGWQLNSGDLCEQGSQLRPDIVWFGEAVPMMEPAAHLASQADLFAVVGTSLLVYPAASLLQYARADVPKYIVDPNIPEVGYVPNLKAYAEPASSGVQSMKEDLLKRLT